MVFWLSTQPEKKERCTCHRSEGGDLGETAALEPVSKAQGGLSAMGDAIHARESG